MHKFVKVVVGTSAVVASLALLSYTPENTVRNGFMDFTPRDGFVWAHPDGLSFETLWEPGVAHPEVKGLIAANEVNNWRPSPGYEWSDEDQTSLHVHWVGGLRYQELPNIVSAPRKGEWVADPGYTFVSSTQSLAVRWTPGAAHPSLPNIIAAEKPETWEPAPGYEYASGSGFAVVPAAETDPSFANGFFKAVVGTALSNAAPDDGFIADFLMRPLGEAIKQGGIEEMVDVTTNP
jgi:hypothetical protein